MPPEPLGAGGILAAMDWQLALSQGLLRGALGYDCTALFEGAREAKVLHETEELHAWHEEGSLVRDRVGQAAGTVHEGQSPCPLQFADSKAVRWGMQDEGCCLDPLLCRSVDGTHACHATVWRGQNSPALAKIRPHVVRDNSPTTQGP